MQVCPFIHIHTLECSYSWTMDSFFQILMINLEIKELITLLECQTALKTVQRHNPNNHNTNTLYDMACTYSCYFSLWFMSCLCSTSIPQVVQWIIKR